MTQDFDHLIGCFHAALELPEGERCAYVDGLGLEEEPRRELDRMLAAYAKDDSFLDPVAGPALDLRGASPGEDPNVGKQIASYRITRAIASGGMGTVYEATQESPRRRVALKILHPSLGSNEVLARFRREAEILGSLAHPGIAQIFEAGSAELGGRAVPFISMELIDGEPITEHVLRNSLDRREIVKLVAEVADAVAFANQRGVVHRDLKPSNVLVDDEGHPKVVDFGVAHTGGVDGRLETLQTSPGALLGTLTHMSPEQVSSGRTAVDQRTDVHALGILLFELLTGTLPYDVVGRPLPDALRTIADADPARLVSVDAGLGGDLDAIASKALEKQPGRRYETAAAMAADLRRHLRHEPVVARPPSTVDRLVKLSRRHRLLVGSVAAVTLSLAIGLFATLRAAGEASREAERARGLNDIMLEIITSFDPSGRPLSGYDGIEEGSGGPLDRLLANSGAFAGDLETEASFRLAIGQALEGVGRDREAKAEMERAVALYAQLPGHDAEYVQSLALLAYIVSAAPFHDEPAAVKAARMAVDTARATLDPGNVWAMAAELEFGKHSGGALSPTEKAQLAAQVAKRSRAILPADHLLVAAAGKQAITTEFELEGNMQRAMSAAEELLSACREVSESTPAYLLALMATCQMHFLAGDWSSAAAYSAEAIALSVKLRGAQHRESLELMATFGWCYYRAGDLEEAEKLFLGAIALLPEGRDPADSGLVQILVWYAVMLRDTGRQGESFDVFLQCVPYFQPEHRGSLTQFPALPRLVFNALAATRPPEESLHFARMLLERVTAEGIEHAGLASFVSAMAWDLRTRGEAALNVAEGLATWAVSLHSGGSTSGTHAHAAALDTLAVLCRLRGGDLGRAESLSREALQLIQPMLSEERAGAARFQMHLAECLASLGREDEARKEFAAALAVAEDCDPAVPALIAEIIAARDTPPASGRR